MAKKIEKLTPRQEVELIETCEQWIKVGTSCEPIDRERARKAISAMYCAIGKPEPVVLFFSSPATCFLASEALHSSKILRDRLGGEIRDQLWNQLSSNIKCQLWEQLGGKLWDHLVVHFLEHLSIQIGEQLRNQLGDRIGGKLWDQIIGKFRELVFDNLRKQLWEQVNIQLGDHLMEQIGEQIRENLTNYFPGQHDILWAVFYDFCNRIGVNYTESQRKNLDLWIEQSRACHWWIPYDGIVFASERHCECHFNSRGQLHRDGGMAVRYSDGWGLYRLNGVDIPEEYVMASAESIDPKHVLEEKNVEVRRELIRKIGVERFIQAAGARVIHKHGDYELLSVKLSEEVTDARFLKMLNPSIGVWHVEGVAPSISTVQEAINWRAGIEEGKSENWDPLVIT